MTEGSALYGVLDAARDRRLHDLVTATRNHACLFSGTLDPPLHLVAPYLVRLDPAEPLFRLWQQEWGRSWGIVCSSGSGLDGLRRHLRRFLQALLPDGTVALFRFYDPRVFRTYLPGCDADDLADWFNGVDWFRAEARNGGHVTFRFDGRALVTDEQ